MSSLSQIRIAGLLFFLVALGFVLASQRGGLKWLHWRFKLYPKVKLVKSHRTDATDSDTPRRFQGVVFYVILFTSLAIAFRLASYLLLFYIYGFSRVFNEGLDIVKMPKASPWIVSNGDQIQPELHAVHFVIIPVIWLPLTYVGAALTWRFLPKAKNIVSKKNVR